MVPRVAGAWGAVVRYVAFTITLVSPLGALTGPVAHSSFPGFKRGIHRVVCCELQVNKGEDILVSASLAAGFLSEKWGP